MKKGGCFLIFIILVLVGCAQTDLSQLNLSKLSQDELNKLIICNKPYIRYGADCCLDKDDNSICDKDETKELIVGPGEEYTLIQQAVDAAAPGDTIIVNDGHYKENIEINKKLTLKANNAVLSPIDNTLPGFSVTADDVSISGFTVSGFSNSYAMLFKDVKNCIASDNSVDSNMWGIVIYSSDNCEVTKNIINNHMGFWAREGDEAPPSLIPSIESSVVPSSGIEIIESDYILIEDNKLVDNVNAIDIVESHHNIISDNKAEQTELVYESTRYNNGINVIFGSNNTIKNNFISKYADAIDIDDSSHNLIINNIVHTSVAAINLDDRSNYNTISGNYVKNNDIGIFLWTECSKNIIEKNTLVGNKKGIAFYHNSNYNIVKQTSILESRGIDIYSENSKNNKIIDSVFETHEEKNSTLEII